jgi:hypothetical protein
MDENIHYTNLELETALPNHKEFTNEELLLIFKELLLESKLMRKELNERIANESSLIFRAFPNSDPDSHRLSHELHSKLLQERADFWSELRVSVATWGMIGVLGFIIVTVWKALLLGPIK